jgi:hypothetical protein
LAGDHPVSDTKHTENVLEMKKQTEEKKLHRMAKLHDLLKMWQGSKNLHATQKESCARNMQMIEEKCILDMEVIIKASWSVLQHDGVAVFNLSERSPLALALSAKDLPGGHTHIIYFPQI